MFFVKVEPGASPFPTSRKERQSSKKERKKIFSSCKICCPVLPRAPYRALASSEPPMDTDARLCTVCSATAALPRCAAMCARCAGCAGGEGSKACFTPKLAQVPARPRFLRRPRCASHRARSAQRHPRRHGIGLHRLPRVRRRSAFRQATPRRPSAPPHTTARTDEKEPWPVS